MYESTAAGLGEDGGELVDGGLGDGLGKVLERGVGLDVAGSVVSLLHPITMCVHPFICGRMIW